MDRFDQLLKDMAEKEEVIVPEGFDKCMQDVLDNLPSRVKKKGLGAVKGVLIAAAVCAAMVCTAFAASPGLRDMLAQALGGFAPYAQEQEGGTYVINGMEFRVVSALADDFTVRAYVEVRDLEGERLSGVMAVRGLVDIPKKDTGEGVKGFTSGAECVGYDEESKTALLAITSWGQVQADDLAGSQVWLFALGSGLGAQEFWTNEEDMAIPVEIAPMTSLIIGTELTTAFQAEEVRLSPLGLSVIFKNDDSWPAFAGVDLRVQMVDGSVDAPWKGGQGSFGTYGMESSRKVLVWNFQEPVDLDQVAGVYIGGDYFPIQ